MEKEIETSKVVAFLKVKKGGKSSPVTQEVLTSYHLVCEEHSKIYPTVSGLLLFGSKPQRHFSEAFITCSHFKGISGREVIATVDCTGTLFEQFDTAFDFI